MMDCPVCGLNCGDTCYRPSQPDKTVVYVVTKEIIERNEGAIRKKLIELGWTPPPEEPSE